MKSNKLFILFSIVITLLLASLLFLLKKHSLTFFIIGEVLTVLIFILIMLIYNQFIKPIHTINAAVNLLREKDFNTRLSKTGQKNTDNITDVYNRMAENLREERIKNEEKNFFLELLIEASPAGIIIFTLDNKILKINPAACNILMKTKDECIGKTIDQLQSSFSESLKSLQTNETKLIQENGIKRYRVQKATFLDKGNSRQFILIEELTKELIKTERSSFEKVIRMMSHEVNNTVAAVNSIMEVVADELKQNHNPDLKDSINVSIERNKSMNEFMANFASVVKMPAPKPEKVNLENILDKVAIIFNQELKNKNIELRKNYADQNMQIYADAILMEQVFINIIKNAIESMEENGLIEINFDPVKKLLVISDNGKGLTPEESKQIFTPFYSTKKNGQGIGLTLVREILLAHNFDFYLSTNEEGITEFLMHFNPGL